MASAIEYDFGMLAPVIYESIINKVQLMSRGRLVSAAGCTRGLHGGRHR